MPEVSVLIADSQRLFARCLAVTLGQYEGLAPLQEFPESGLSAIDAVVSFRPDVVILDYWLPDMEAPPVIDRMLAAVPDQKIVVLCWFHGPQHVRRCLEAGAVGFLTRSCDPDLVAEAVRGAAAGESLVLGERLAELSESLSRKHAANLEISRRMQTLSKRELEVLMILQTGMPVDEVAGHLFISTKTVQAHIGSILRKSGARSHSEAVAMAQVCGLIR